MKEEVAGLLDQVPAMKTRFDSARSRYDVLSRSVHEKVAKFEWCRAPRYSHRPFGIERSGWKPALPMKSEPKEKNGRFRYGFSATADVLIEEQYVEFADQCYETFAEYSPDRIDSTHFSYWREKPVINVETTLSADGVAMGFIRYAERGLFAEAYEYSGGLLVRAHQAAQEHEPSSSRHKLTTTIDEFMYAGKQLTRVVRIWEAGGSETIYQ